jgi:hypothetical protein
MFQDTDLKEPFAQKPRWNTLYIKTKIAYKQIK